MQTNFFLHFVHIIKSRIRYKIFLASICAIIIPVFIFGLLSYKLSSVYIESDFILYNQDKNLNISKSIDDSYFSLQKQIFSQLVLIDDIRYLLNPDSALYTDQYFTVIDRLNNLFSFQQNANTSLYGVSYIDMKGNVKYTVNMDNKNTSLKTVEKTSWFADTIELNGLPLFIQPHYSDFLFYNTTESRTSIVSISQVVFDPDYGNPIGIILVDQETEQFFGYPSDSFLSENHSIAIFSNIGELVYTNKNIDQNLITAYEEIYNQADNERKNKKIDRQEILFIPGKLSKFGFRIISAMPVSDLQKRSLFLRNNTYILLAILLVLIISASYLISNILTRKIGKLKALFDEIGQGHFDISIPAKGSDEIAEIALQFNGMVANIKQLIQETYLANLLRKQARLDSLYSQINPHFLYNTLNSIKVVIDDKDSATASSMIQNLSDFLRYTLKKGKIIVSLYEEIEHAKNYMSIQKERYKNKYSISYEIAPDTLYSVIPWLTLQPLIENSIQHGFESHKTTGEIRITTKKLDDVVLVYLYDNGVGITEEQLSAINETLTGIRENPESAQHSIGIFNVNSRIKLHFGENFGLQLSSSFNEHTIVKITLPYSERS